MAFLIYNDMKYLKKFNESFDRVELKRQIAEMNKRTKADVDYVKGNLPEFINTITNLITLNHQLDYLDDNKIQTIVKKHFGNIPYLETFTSPKSSTQQLVSYILNVGYSIGYYVPLNEHPDVDFSELIEDIMKIAQFDRIDDRKLKYKGPDIKSSSILATCTNIEQSINNKESYNRFMEDHEDEEFPELILLFSQIYRYGYGLGNDEGELQKWVNNAEYDRLQDELFKAIKSNNEPEMLRIMDLQDKLRK